MEDRRVDENLDFEDLRHVGSVSPTTLANQYRLSQKPRRPEKKKIARKKKLSSGSHDDEIPHSASMRHLSTASSHDWLLNMDEEDFDFDGMYTRQKFQLHRLLICPWCGPFIENWIKTQRCRCNYHLRMLWSAFLRRVFFMGGINMKNSNLDARYFDIHVFKCHMNTDRNHYKTNVIKIANTTMFLRQKTEKQLFQNGLN